MIRTIKEIILKAAEEIAAISALEPEPKGKIGDVVTLADKKSEEIISNELKTKFPGCKILTEETVSEITKDNFTDIELLFVVDPIDGTTNYLFNIPQSAISIGAYKYGKPICGVIYDIFRQDIYQAETGKGCSLNGSKIEKKKALPLEEAVVGSSWGYGETSRPLVEKWGKLVGKVAMLRVMGSASLDMAMTASGQFTCYFHNSLKPYDSGAGLIILREMGIKTTNWQGKEFTIFDQEIIAAPAEIYDEFYDLLF